MPDIFSAEDETTKPEILICDSEALIEGGKGVRFPVTAFGVDAIGFAVRYKGTAHAYLNRCAHVPIELDWAEGEFFESSGLYLMCATHGAIYLPESGRCAGGPCRGGGLHKISVIEKEKRVYWLVDDRVTPVRG
ncbi:MAG: Rieske (2Fe-2S) protein [Janthinobacterium lividum]